MINLPSFGGGGYDVMGGGDDGGGDDGSGDDGSGGGGGGGCGEAPTENPALRSIHGFKFPKDKTMRFISYSYR